MEDNMLKLKIAKIKKGLNQYKIASLAGMSQSKFSSIERSDIKANLLDQKKIAKILGCSINEIFSEDKN